MDSPSDSSPAVAGAADLSGSAAVPDPKFHIADSSSLLPPSHSSLEPPTEGPRAPATIPCRRLRSGSTPACLSAQPLPCTGTVFSEDGRSVFGPDYNNRFLSCLTSLELSVLSSPGVTTSVLSCLDELRSAHVNGQWSLILSLQNELSSALLPSILILKEQRKRRINRVDASNTVVQLIQNQNANGDHIHGAKQPLSCRSGTQQLTPSRPSRRPTYESHSGRSETSEFLPSVREDASFTGGNPPLSPCDPPSPAAARTYYSSLLCPSFSCPDLEAELFSMASGNHTGGRSGTQLSKKSSSGFYHFFSTRVRGGSVPTAGKDVQGGGETENDSGLSRLRGRIRCVLRLIEEAALGLYEARVDASLHSGETTQAERLINDFITGGSGEGRAPSLFPPSSWGPLPLPLRRWRERRRDRHMKKSCVDSKREEKRGYRDAVSDKRNPSHEHRHQYHANKNSHSSEKNGEYGGNNSEDTALLSHAFFLQPFLYRGGARDESSAFLHSTRCRTSLTSCDAAPLACGGVSCDFPPLDVWLLWVKTLAGVSSFSDLQEALASASPTVIWSLLCTCLFPHNKRTWSSRQQIRASANEEKSVLSSFSCCPPDTEGGIDLFRPLHVQLALFLSSSPSRFNHRTENADMFSNRSTPVSPTHRRSQKSPPSHLPPSALDASSPFKEGQQTSPASPPISSASLTLFSPFFFFAGFRRLPLIRQVLVVEALAVMGLLCQRAGCLDETALGLYDLVFLLTCPTSLLMSKHRSPLLPALAGGILLFLQANLASQRKSDLESYPAGCRPPVETNSFCPSIPATSLFLLLLPPFLKPFWERIWPQSSSSSSSSLGLLSSSSSSVSLQPVLDFVDMQWNVLRHSRLCRPLPSEFTLSFSSSFLSKLTASTTASTGPPGFFRQNHVTTPGVQKARPSRSETCVDVPNTAFMSRRSQTSDALVDPNVAGNFFSGYNTGTSGGMSHGRSKGGGRSGSGLWGRKASFVKHLHASRDYLLQGFTALLNSPDLIPSSSSNRLDSVQASSSSGLSLSHLLYIQSQSRLNEYFVADGGLLRSLILDPICPFSRESLTGVRLLRQRLWLGTLHLTLEPGGPLSSHTNRALRLAGLALEQKKHTCSQLRGALTTMKHASALLAGVPADVCAAELKARDALENVGHPEMVNAADGRRASGGGGVGGFLRPGHVTASASAVKDSVCSSFRRAFSRAPFQSSPQEGGGDESEFPPKQTPPTGGGGAGEKEDTKGLTSLGIESSEDRAQVAQAHSGLAISSPQTPPPQRSHHPLQQQKQQQQTPSPGICCSMEHVLSRHWSLIDEQEESAWVLSLSPSGSAMSTESKTPQQNRDGHSPHRSPGALTPAAAKAAQAACVRVYNESLRTSYLSGLFLRFLPACVMDPRYFIGFQVEHLKELENYQPMPFKAKRLAVLLARWCSKAGRPSDAHGDPASVYASSIIHAVRRYETRLAASRKGIDSGGGACHSGDSSGLAEAALGAVTAIGAALTSLLPSEENNDSANPLQSKGRRGGNFSSARQVRAGEEEPHGQVISEGDEGHKDRDLCSTNHDMVVVATHKIRLQCNPGGEHHTRDDEGEENGRGGAWLWNSLLRFLLDTIELTALSQLMFANYSVRSGERLVALRLGDESSNTAAGPERSIPLPQPRTNPGGGTVSRRLFVNNSTASSTTRAVVIKGGGNLPIDDGVYVKHLTELLEHTFLLSLSSKVNEPLLRRLLERLAVTQCLQGNAVLSVAALDQRIARHSSMLRSFEDSRGGLRLMDAQTIRRLFDAPNTKFSRGFLSSLKAHLLLVCLQRPFSAGLAATQGLHDLARERLRDGQRSNQISAGGGPRGNAEEESETRDVGKASTTLGRHDVPSKEKETAASQVKNRTCMVDSPLEPGEDISSPLSCKTCDTEMTAFSASYPRLKASSEKTTAPRLIAPFATSLSVPHDPSVREECSALVLLLSLGEASLIQARHTRLFTVPPGLLPAPPFNHPTSTDSPCSKGIVLGPLDLLDNAESERVPLRSGDERRIEVTTYSSLVNRAYRCAVGSLQLWSGPTDYRVWALLAWTTMHAFDVPACAEFARRALLLDRRDTRMWLVLAWCHSGRLPVDAPAPSSSSSSDKQDFLSDTTLKLSDTKRRKGEESEGAQRVSFADNTSTGTSEELPGSDVNPMPSSLPLIDPETDFFSLIPDPPRPPPFPAAPVLDPRYSGDPTGSRRSDYLPGVDAGLLAFSSIISDGLEELPTSLALVAANTWTQARHSPQFRIFSFGETHVSFFGTPCPGAPGVCATGALVGSVATGETGTGVPVCTCKDGLASKAGSMLSSNSAAPPQGPHAPPAINGASSGLPLFEAATETLETDLSNSKLNTTTGEGGRGDAAGAEGVLQKKNDALQSGGGNIRGGDDPSPLCEGTGESDSREKGEFSQATTTLNDEGALPVKGRDAASVAIDSHDEGCFSSELFWLAEERRRLALDKEAACASAASGVPSVAALASEPNDALAMILSDESDATDVSTDTEVPDSDNTGSAPFPLHSLETSSSSVFHGATEASSGGREEEDMSASQTQGKKENKHCRGRSYDSSSKVDKKAFPTRSFMAVEDALGHLHEFCSTLETEAQQRVNSASKGLDRKDAALCFRCRAADHVHLLPCAMHALQKLSIELADEGTFSGGSQPNKSSLASAGSGLQRMPSATSTSLASSGSGGVGSLASRPSYTKSSSSYIVGRAGSAQTWDPYCSVQSGVVRGAPLACACILHDCPQLPRIESLLDSAQPLTPSYALRRKQALLRTDLGFSADPYAPFYSGGGPHRTDTERSRGVALIDSRQLEREAVGWMAFAELLCHLQAPGKDVFMVLRIAGLYLQCLRGVCAAGCRDLEGTGDDTSSQKLVEGRVRRKNGSEKERREGGQGRKSEGAGGFKESAGNRAKNTKKDSRQEGHSRSRKGGKQRRGREAGDETFACSRCGSLCSSKEIDDSPAAIMGCMGEQEASSNHTWGCPLSKDSDTVDEHSEGCEGVVEGWRVAELLGVKLEFLRLYAQYFYFDCVEAIARERLDSHVLFRLFPDLTRESDSPLHLWSAADQSANEEGQRSPGPTDRPHEAGCVSPDGGDGRAVDKTQTAGHLSSKTSSALGLSAHRGTPAGIGTWSGTHEGYRRRRGSQEGDTLETKDDLFEGIGTAALASATILSACPELDSAGRGRDLCPFDARMGLESLLDRVRAFRRMHPFARPPQILEARILYRQRNVTAAAETLEDIVALDTRQMYLNSDTDFLQDAVAVYIYGRCMQTLGQFERATRAYERATQLYFYAPMLACSFLSLDQRRSGSVDELIGGRYGSDGSG
ncbi:tetratricopeptide repeat-containing protein [Cystoisospora suis]|uniref:Tetratricopeptide repeat-containing protein n=1 Tax=Cystoisospora suis TaxID=483139 RepID=A0A2C6KRB6_9APIC|nr:tetratricopeptide repeat-containing protein [Cystoisospora suis]